MGNIIKILIGQKKKGDNEYWLISNIINKGSATQSDNEPVTEKTKRIIIN